MGVYVLEYRGISSAMTIVFVLPALVAIVTALLNSSLSLSFPLTYTMYVNCIYVCLCLGVCVCVGRAAATQRKCTLNVNTLRSDTTTTTTTTTFM